METSSLEKEDGVKVKLLAVAAMAVFLPGCSLVIEGPRESQGGPRLTNAEYATSHTLDDRFVICDDRNTVVALRAEFEGDVSRVRVWLEGINGGSRTDADSFVPSDQFFEVAYVIPPGVAPLALSTGSPPEFESQAIVVTPKPQIVGYTSVHIEFEGELARGVSTDPIPVLAVCG